MKETARQRVRLGEVRTTVDVRATRCNPDMVAEATPLEDALNTLVDDDRATCLWFLRPDYYPVTRAERLRVLDSVQRHGDRAAHVRAGHLLQWLSQTSSADSAAS